MLIEFPRKNVISQEELAPVCAVEAHLDEILEILYQRLANGAVIESGDLTVNMRRRPIRAVEERQVG